MDKNFYQLYLENYQGPLDKLLELVEEQKMEINSISLSKVTSDFLNYIKQIENNASPDLISEFLVIASKLILIKTKSLLPNLELNQEDEEEIKNLEWALKVHKEFKIAQNIFKNIWNIMPLMGNREFLANIKGTFYPATNMTLNNFQNSMENIFQELNKIFKPVSIIKNTIINIQEKIQEIFNRLQANTLYFDELKRKINKTRNNYYFFSNITII
ncbi:MAG: segregation and condensation protein A [Minisyncoccia bacterium]